MKLNQLIAIIAGAKASARKKQTDVYQVVQKGALFSGVTRTFSPREEDGYVYPAENQAVQMSAQKCVADFIAGSGEFLDLAFSQDLANCSAVADIRVDGVTLASLVPVTHLLFLEKQIIDIRTFVASLPTLPIDKAWTYDANKGCHVSEARQTAKTKKITEFVVAYQATQQHPAQIKEVSKDVIEGEWTTVDMSGALPKDVRDAILGRCDRLLQAVLKAREEANSIEVNQRAIADSLFSYIFGTMTSSTS